MKNRCQDEGDAPGCLGVADERYTMRFDDIGERPIFWCAACGPRAHALQHAIEQRFAGDPSFAKDFAQAVTEAEADMKARLN